MKDLFKVDAFTEGEESDILGANINEGSSEFDTKCPATNPTVPFDSTATGAKDTNIPVPGGDKETPTGKPYDSTTISIPGGTGESPSGKQYDAASIPVPSKTTLTADQYNNALSMLKKSFKEGVEIMDMLEHANVVDKTQEQLQMEYTESVLEEAVIASFIDGPMFEAATDDKKEEIKKAAKAIVRRIKDERKSGNAKYENVTNLREATWFGRIIGSNPEIGRSAWKNVAMFNTTKGNLKKVLANFCKEFATILGDLTLNVDCLCDFDELSKLDDTTNKDKKDFEDAAKTVGNYYLLYVDSKKNEAVKTVKIHGLNAAIAKLK